MYKLDLNCNYKCDPLLFGNGLGQGSATRGPRSRMWLFRPSAAAPCGFGGKNENK